MASGFDWRSLVDQLVDVERTPQKRLLQDQNLLEQRNNAYSSIKTQLAVLQNRVDALKDPALFESRSLAISDESIARATSTAGTPLGSYVFNVSQLASAAKLNGTANIAAPISSTDDVSGVTLASASFSTAITSGTLTVNGKQISISSSDSLQSVFSAIETATGGDVTASYDSSTDTISLSSAGEIVLGSATDTSNFFQAARLHNNGTGAITSTGSLGGIKRATTLDSANFATAINDGGAGVFKINGVEISYSASDDSLNNIIDRINQSQAGVLATYDAVSDRVVLTNKTTGDVGVAVEDVTGNFAAAAGLTTGTLQRGQNLEYSVNGSGTLISQTNTITESSSGIAGLSVTALAEGETTVTVNSDTGAIKTAIQDFITEYNKAQSIIETQTASSTDNKGKVTAGLLSGESDASQFASLLRSLAYKTVSGFAAEMNQLADIGIITSGNDNSLTLDDEAALDNALANNLTAVQKLFSDSTSGLAVKLSEYVESINGDEGTIAAKQNRLSEEAASIDVQILDLERIVQANRESMIASFITMETAQSQINQQLQFLAQRFGTAAPK